MAINDPAVRPQDDPAGPETIVGGEPGRRSFSGRALPILSWVGCLLFAVAIFLTAVTGRRHSSDYLADLFTNWHSVRTFAHHGSLYDYTSAMGYRFSQPPFAGILLSPIAFLPAAQLANAWSVLVLLGGCALAYVIAPDVARRLSTYWPPDRWRRTPILPLVALALISAGPMLSNLSRGQISLFIGLLVLLDAARLIPPRWQGIATGIAAATTLAPLAFVPYLWLTNRRRAAVVSVATFAGCTGIGWLVAPRDSARYWLMGLWQGDHPDLSSSVSDLSIRGILTTFGLHGEFALLIWTILATLIACRALSRARQADAAGAHVLGAAIVGAMAMCLSPISGEYDAIWLVIAIVATPWSAPRRWLYWTTIVFLVVSVLRPISVIEFAIYASHTVTTAIVAVVVAKAEGFFAVAIACLVPFQALRNNEPPRQNPPYAGLQSEPTAPV